MIQNASLTLGELLFVAGLASALVVGAWRLFLFLDSRMTKKADEASTVAVAKAIGVELKVDRVSDDLSAFRLEVARGYVTTDYQRRLEDRMEQGFAGVREDVASLRAVLMTNWTDRPSRRPPRE